MGLAVLIVENACTELVDVTSVMLQNLFNCIGVPSAGRLLSYTKIKKSR